MRPLTANLVLLACAAIWGFAFLFQKSAMAHVEPLQFVAARCAVAAIVLAPLVLIEHRRASRTLSAGMPGTILLAGAVFFVAAWLQQRGIVTASVTNSAFLTTLYIVVTPLLAWALMRQPAGPLIWGAVMLSAFGAWMLGGGGATAFGGGDLLVVASTLFWALHVVVLAIAARNERPILLTAGQFALAALIAGAGAMAVETIDLTALARAAPEIAFVGILSSAVTFTLFAWALRGTTAATATIVASAEAPFAAIGAYLILGEQLTPVAAGGALLMLLAVFVAQHAAVHKA